MGFFLRGGLYPWHVEVPRLGVESELQLLACTTATATAMPDLSCICHLHHSRILNLLSKARDRTFVLMDTFQICYHWATGTPVLYYSKSHVFFCMSHLCWDIICIQIKVYNSMFSQYIHSYAIITTINFKTFPSSPKENPYLLPITSDFPSVLPVLGNHLTAL